MKKPLRNYLICFTIPFGMVGLFLLAIPFLGPAWHVVYGDTVSYSGWTFNVPKGFLALHDVSDGGSMWRLGLGIPWFESPYGHLTIRQRSGVYLSYEEHYDKFEGIQIEMASDTGHELSLRREVPVGDRKAYCVEFLRPDKMPHALIRCMIENSGFLVSYEGHPKYLEDAYSTVASAVPEMSDP